MFKTSARVALIAALTLTAAACGRDSATGVAAAGDKPDQAILASAKYAKQGDIAALVEHMLPPADFARIKAEWNDKKNAADVSDEDRAKFAATMAKLTAPNAADTLYAEIEPDLKQFDAQYKQQLPTMVAMGQGYLTSMVQQSQQLSAAEKEQANNAIKALAEWVQKTNFTDPALVKQSLAIFADTARELDLKTLDDARALNFEQSAPKLKIAFNGFKKVLSLYGFSMDDTFDSVKTDVVSSDGNAAKIKVGYTLLGTALATETEMVRIDGRWYGKDTIEKLKQRAADSAMPADAPAVAPKTNG